MPPRARRKKTEPVEDVVTEVENVEEPVEESAEEQPERKKPGRKKSVLAEAARNFEKYNNVVEVLEKRYAAQAEKLADTAADLEKARAIRDDAKDKLDSALNGG
jgi:flagellar biosynthesis chaperone FliJ